MPSIGTKIPRKRKIEGYKIAIKDGGRYRSIFTWHVYQVGKKIAKFKYNFKKEKVEEVPFPLQTHTWFCFEEEYNGYTSIFKNEKDARLTNIGINDFWLSAIKAHIVLLKVTISDDIREKKTGKREIYLGKKFEEIKEIRSLNNT